MSTVLLAGCTSLWRTWAVLLLPLWQPYPSSSLGFNRCLCCPLTFGMSQTKATGSVEQRHRGVWEALPLEMSVLQRLIQTEVEAPSMARVLQVTPQGGLEVHLQLLSVHWAEYASSSGAGLPDRLVSIHRSALQETSQDQRLVGKPLSDITNDRSQ
ncbi:hypothetical protein EYF80_004231 [Liparis tanakae]|uniref:Uncharacterized protein n=1 Tax=Liparis tanakae TaxID=230148 RepID=A0A4Z2J7E2_9TELE|nr:hypothetical protein EYF80_004231 [Liparis tanakae]